MTNAAEDLWNALPDDVREAISLALSYNGGAIMKLYSDTNEMELNLVFSKIDAIDEVTALLDEAESRKFTTYIFLPKEVSDEGIKVRVIGFNNESLPERYDNIISELKASPLPLDGIPLGGDHDGSEGKGQP